MTLFNGRYILPELSWKIWKEWGDQTFKTDNRRIQIVNDSVNQKIYITLPDRQMLYADYGDGLNAKDIKWTPWRFDINVTTIALMNTDTLFMGSDSQVEE